MLSDTGLKAFLAQTLHVQRARKWNVETAKGKHSGQVSAGKGQGRVWESRKHPLAEKGTMEIELSDGQTLRFSEINAPQRNVQNVFILDTGRNTVVVFFAFFDGQPERYQPAWRIAEYTMELIKP